MNCPVCGGTMIGDGYTTPIHCENVVLDPWIEVDFGPIYCIEESPEISDRDLELDRAYEANMAEQAYQHELDRDLELDRAYEANIPLSPSGAGIVYGWEEDIPF